MRDDTKLWAPGLSERPRAGGKIAYYWIASNCSRHTKSYPTKTVRLHQATEEERAAYCQRLYKELTDWLGEQAFDPKQLFDGTIKSLVEIYQVDKQSPFHSVKANTREGYVWELTQIQRRVGNRRLKNLTGHDFLRWYESVKKPATEGAEPHLRKAHGFMTMVRMIINWGIVLGLPDCERLSLVLSKLRFQQPPSRKTFVSYDQVQAIIPQAHDAGRSSVALAQALQFELTLRQSEVIGQWLKFEGPAPEGGLVYGRRQWGDGLLWSDIDASMILRKSSSKTGQVMEFDLTLYPLVMQEINRVPKERRIGPMIIDESSGVPYKWNQFSKVWREIARSCGVPDNVWNRDSRAGGVSEATSVAGLELVRHHAQHSDPKTTAKYSRDTLEKTSKVAKLRTAARQDKGK